MKTKLNNASNTGSITDRLILVRLKQHHWSGRKFDKAASDELVQAHGKEDSEDIGRFNKILIDKRALEAVRSARHELDKRHKYFTAPWLDGGVRVLPSALYFEYVKQVREANAEYVKAGEAFVRAYPKELEAAKERLGPMFKASDYPSVDEIAFAHRAADVYFEPLPNPQDVRVWGVGEVAAREIEQHVRSSVQNGIDAAHVHVASTLIERAQEFAKKLQALDAWMAREHEVEAWRAALQKRAEALMREGVDKKEAKARALEEAPPRPKPVRGEETNTLRASAVENLREMVEVVLSGLNVKQDPALTDMARQLEVSLRNVDVDTLRDTEQVRKAKINEVERIAGKFAGVFGPAVAAGGAR